MVLARKESTYTNDPAKDKKKSQIHKKKQKNYRLEKIIVVFVVFVVFMFSILILMKFTAITEARYNVNNLEKQLEKLEIEKAKLKVDLEKVSKSEWIENEAKTRLQMDYPIAGQIIGINVDPAKVAILTNKINKTNNDDSVKLENNNYHINF